MAELIVDITGITDNGGYPLWAKAEFTDRFGQVHKLYDKLPVFAADDDMTVPRKGTARCFIAEDCGEYLIVELSHPDYIEDENGDSRFEVDKNLVRVSAEKGAAMSPVALPALDKLLNEFDDCVIDYHIMRGMEPHRGEKSHRDAVLFAMERESAQCRADIGEGIAYDSSLMRGVEIPAQMLLCSTVRTWGHGSEAENCIGKSYWCAFSEPPYGRGLRRKDFDRLNKVLFPMGADTLEVYSWSTDWSEYFDVGNEWWGCICISVYDRAADRYVVMMASATD